MIAHTIPELSESVGPMATEALSEAVGALRAHLPVAEVWLFGSCARRTARKGSDLDLMVVLKDGHNLRRPTLECFKIVNRIHSVVPVDVVPIDKSRWEFEKRHPFGLFGEIATEGICIYAE